MHKTHRQLFFDHLAQTIDTPLELTIEKAEGLYMYAPDGKQYLDLISGIGVSNVGHRHPAVVEAIHKQVDQYLHVMVYGDYIQAPQVLLAGGLVETLDSELASKSPYGKIDNVYLTNSGAEAVEGAMKLAKRFTGRTQFVSCKNVYHGSTQGALSLAGADFYKQSFRPLLPGVTHITHGNIDEIVAIDEQTAAIVIEVVSGESGVRVPDLAYMEAIRARCTEVGALLILDEIQTGFGRTGKFWAFEHYNIYPDVLLSAKGMGGGMPIGAFMASKQLMTTLTFNPLLGHITTFGGHPVSAAAAFATLNVIREEDLYSKAIEKGQLVYDALITNKHVKQIRHKGLMMAVEFESFDTLRAVINACLEEGVVTDWFLFCNNSMRIAPPLIITNEELATVCAKINEVIYRVLG